MIDITTPLDEKEAQRLAALLEQVFGRAIRNALVGKTPEQIGEQYEINAEVIAKFVKRKDAK